MATAAVQHPHHQAALPLFDLFLDLPHPAAASGCPPPSLVGVSISPELEKEFGANLSRIGRFAFPEFDDAASASIPRDAATNRFSQYAMQPKTFQHYTFSMQLQNGTRVHGHVRRYLPNHSVAKTRYDVGRRGERALVLLTRANGGDLVYSAILKTLDAISFERVALIPSRQPHADPIKWFLTKLFEHHRALCGQFASLPQQERKPMLLTVPCVEAGELPIQHLALVDTCRFLIPTQLLSPTSSAIETVASSSILPILRVLGIQNTLRLMSALLSESRVLLLSSSPTRLAQCARSALSILAQGLLNWQHLFIPVLPPHLFQYLAAPVPYLIGMLTSLAPRLDQTPGLGEIIIINLDSCQMETRNINPMEVAKIVPDLFRTAMSEQGMPVSTMSATEMLAQDLVDLLKIDKRTLHGESALTNVSETAAKATKAVKSGLLKLKEKGKKFLKKQSGSTVSDSGEDDDMDAGDQGASSDGGTSSNTLLPDFIYTQGAQNETAEGESRIAFTSFFLSMFGNMRWYLSASPGKLPQLDRQRFLQQKRAMGEGENTPIWPLLENFCQTQMLEQFAKARVEEVRTRYPVTADSPLFSQCGNYHRLHNVDFSVVSVRRVARQVAQNNPERHILQTTARRTAMTLTSNRTFEGDYNNAVAELVEECRESSSVLFDVMSVIWVRLRDSKGLHWKHGFQALQILRNLIYHGPLAAIAEATDGLDKIRIMKFYNDNMRSQICTQIRQVANQVYNLLVDRAKLFNIRRLCINKRRLLRKPALGRFNRDSRMRATASFVKLHQAFNPKNRRQVAPEGVQQVPQFAAEQDLLGFTSAVPQPPSASNPFVPAPPQPSGIGVGQDLIDAFQTASVSNQPATAATTYGNPFDPISLAAALPANETRTPQGLAHPGSLASLPATAVPPSTNAPGVATKVGPYSGQQSNVPLNSQSSQPLPPQPYSGTSAASTSVNLPLGMQQAQQGLYNVPNAGEQHATPLAAPYHHHPPNMAQSNQETSKSQFDPFR